MPNLRGKTWTTTTPATVGDAQYWEDHLISDEAAQKAAGAVQSVNNTLPDENGNINITPSPLGPTVVDSLNSTSATDALSANMGHELNAKKVDIQQGAQNVGKHLVVGNDGNLALQNDAGAIWGNIGGNITDQTDLQAALAPKVPESLLKDTVGWLGKNELPLTLDGIKTLNTSGTWSGNVYSYQGIAYTVSVDSYGYITEIDVHGTATAESVLKLFVGTCAEMYRYNGQILSGVVGAAASTYRQLIYLGESPYTYYASQRDEEVVISNIPNTASPIQYRFSVDSGINVSHAKFKPMIRNASITDSTFEPYHKSVDAVFETKGDWDTRNISITYIGSVGGNDNDGYRIDESSIQGRSIVAPIENGKTYLISKKNGVGNRFRVIGMNDKPTTTPLSGTQIFSSNDAYQYEFTNNANYSYLLVGLNYDGALNNADIQGMIQLASNANHDYTPYRDPLDIAIPSKMSYADNGVLGAKNLWPEKFEGTCSDLHGTHTYSDHEYVFTTEAGYSSAGFYWSGNSVLKPYYLAKGYTFKTILSFDAKGGDSFFCNFGEEAKNVGVTVGTEYKHYQIPIDDLTVMSSLIFYAKDANASHVLYIKNIMIRVYTDSDDTYAPYAMTNRELSVVNESAVTNIISGASVDSTNGMGNHLRKVGKTVFLELSLTEVTASAWTTLCEIPVGFTPVNTNLRFMSVGASPVLLKVYVDANKKGYLQASSALANIRLEVNISWITD